MKWLCWLWFFFCLSVQAKTELTVLVGLDKPPYIILENNSGYELDLLKLLVKKMGYDAVFLHVPNARIKDLMLEGKADIATLQKPEPELPLYYSQPYISYQNVAASLSSKSLKLLHINHLKPYTVVAFHNARFLLGPEYQQLTASITNYQEVANQSQQLQMLWLQRCDVVIMDRNIFHYYAKMAGHGMQPYNLAVLFKASLYNAAFKNAQLGKKFDKALAELKLEPVFTQLQLKYFSELNQRLQ